MEKIQEIILNNKAYKITSSAYILLSDFLSFIKKKNLDFGDDIEIQASIIIDMELETVGNNKLIDNKIVEEVISVIKENRSIKYTAPRRVRKVKRTSHSNKNKKRFERDLNDKVIGGVCSAISNYLGISVILVRLLFLLGALLKGAFIPIYILLWIITPSKK